MEVLTIPDIYVPAVWGEVEPILKRVDEYMKTDDMYPLLITGKAFLSVVIDEKIVAAFVSEIVDYPRKRVLRLVNGAGDGMSEWAGMVVEHMMEGARRVGAQTFEIQGRKGWARVLESEGMKQKSVILEREV